MSPVAESDAPAPAAASRRSAGASVLSGSVALLSMQPLTWTMSLLAAIVVPRHLGAHGIGVYEVAVNTGALAGSITSLGVPAYLSRRIATAPDRAEAETGAAGLMITVFGAVAAVALAILLPLIRSSGIDPTVLRISMVSMVLAGFQSVLFSRLAGEERFRLYALLSAGGTVSATSAGVVALLLGGGLLSFAWATFASEVVMLVVALIAARFRLRRAAFDLGLWKRIAGGGLPFLGWNVAMCIRANVDIVVVGLLAPATVAGWLAAAYRIIGVTVFIPTLIATPLLPALSRTVDDRAAFGETLRRSLLAVLLFTLPCSAGIAALAPSIPTLMHWPQDFSRSVPLIAILAWQQPLVAVDMVLGAALVALNDERRWLRFAVMAAVFNPSLNLFMIPLFQRWSSNGALGAALVELATELLMLCGALLLLPLELLSRETLTKGLRVLLASAGLTAVAALLRPLSLPLAIAGGAVTFLALILLLRALSLLELRMVSDTIFQALRQRRARSYA